MAAAIAALITVGARAARENHGIPHWLWALEVIGETIVVLAVMVLVLIVQYRLTERRRKREEREKKLSAAPAPWSYSDFLLLPSAYGRALDAIGERKRLPRRQWPPESDAEYRARLQRE